MALPKLTLTAAQTNTLNQIYVDLERVNFYGLSVTGSGLDLSNLDLDPTLSYPDDDKMTTPDFTATELRTLSKQAIARYLATIVTAFNPFPSNGISTTISLAKLTTLGNSGSLTFVNGVLTAVVHPT